MIWEAPGPGRPFGSKVLDLGYGNIFFRRDEKSIRKKVSTVPGWIPSKDDKNEIFSAYKDAINTGEFKVRSSLQLEECRKFIYCWDDWIRHTGQSNPMDPSGARSQHGDRPMAGALCWKGVRLFSTGHQQAGTPVVKEGSMMYRRLMAQKAEQDKAVW